MSDLPPSLITEVLAALVGVLGAFALILRGVPAIIDRIVAAFDKGQQARLVDSQTHASALASSELRAADAERQLDEERDAHAATRRLLEASNNLNADLRAQIAAGHPFRKDRS